MDPATLILLINAVVNLVLRLAENYVPDPETPEELQAKLDEALANLRATAEAVAAWKPIE